MSEIGETPLTSPDNPRIHRPGKRVEVFEITKPHIQTRIDRLYKVVNIEEIEGMPRFRGFADGQIDGEEDPMQIIVLDASEDRTKKEFIEVINPEIVESSKMLRRNKEGCYTFKGIAVITERPEWVEFTGYNRKGEKIPVRRLTGDAAQVFFHEYDHAVKGRTFMSRTRKNKDIKTVTNPMELAEFRASPENYNKIPDIQTVNDMAGRDVLRKKQE